VGFIDQGSAPREMRDRLKDFIDTANRANVTLYAFDPRVYTHGGDDMVDIASTPPGDMEAGQEKVKTFEMLNDLQASQDNLRAMAAETGGFAVTGSPKAVENAFDRVRIENSNYYILAYSSTNEARDGKFRRIEVRVRRPGIRVEARRGYVAPKGNAASTEPLPETKQGTSPAVREALLSTLPVPGFALRATAVPFKGSGRNASVAVIVQTDGRDLQFAERDGRFEDSVELAVVAVDGQGKTRGGERLAVDMPLNDQLRAFVAQAGVVFALRVPLPPGLYDLRVAGRDAGSGRVGAVRFSLEVPDFTQTPLSMSGVVLTADRAGQVPNPRPDEDLAKVLPASPIATRTFATADQLTLFVEVYDNQTADHAVQFQTTVQGEDGRVRFKQDEQRSTAELNGKSGGFGYLASVPLADLGPGSYVLRVEARSSLNADTVASRELQFTVR
jgi:hypothetical protein